MSAAKSWAPSVGQALEDAPTPTPTLARSDEDPRTRTIRWTDPAVLAAESVTRSGLEYLRGIAAGKFPGRPSPR